MNRFEIFPTFGVPTRSRRRLFDRLFDGWMDPHSFYVDGEDWVPVTDIAETEKEYIVTVEVPGVEMSGLDISFNDNTLLIKGEKKKTAMEGECCHCTERYSGSFHRDLAIPGKIVVDKIDATLKDGVLTVILPKSGESMTKKIEIH